MVYFPQEKSVCEMKIRRSRADILLKNDDNNEVYNRDDKKEWRN